MPSRSKRAPQLRTKQKNHIAKKLRQQAGAVKADYPRFKRRIRYRWRKQKAPYTFI
jgi:hypothetical protein